jgi:type IV pilus assembly protein PilA
VNVIAKLRARRDGDESGFTLIELMVVVLIIAILIAIAIPTFLGARERAQDKAAQSSLRNGLTAAKTIYTDQEDYADASVAALQDTEPSLTFKATGAASLGPKEVSVGNTGDNLVVMASESKSGKCFWITDNTQGPGTRFASNDAAAACSATGAPAQDTVAPAVPTGWKTDGW